MANNQQLQQNGSIERDHERNKKTKEREKNIVNNACDSDMSF